MWQRLTSVRSRRIAGFAWLTALVSAISGSAIYLLVLRWTFAAIKHGDFFAYPSPAVAGVMWLTAIVFWCATAWEAVVLSGWKQIIAVIALIVGLPLGFLMLLIEAENTPTSISSIREVNSRTVMLGREPAWDVRAYALFDPIWYGTAWRMRRDDGQDFWTYPYHGEMKVGLDKAGRAILLNPDGLPGPFPDGLTTFPCPSGSPPNCVTRQEPKAR